MKAIAHLAWRSLSNRKATAWLTIVAIAISVMLLLGVERLRHQAKQSFANTVSGTDLVVGARSGAIQLLLYSVFRIGNATNNISWRSYEEIAGRSEVAWSIPFSLGDSHRGFRVLGTTQQYFDHYRYGNKQLLQFAAGQKFDDVFDTVIGAEVAQTLKYAIGDKIIIAHGLGAEGFLEHDDKPFLVVGILAPTGTPVDRTVHVSLQGIEAMHIDWRSGARIPGLHIDAEQARTMDLRPKAVTAMLIGLKSRLATFALQRAINEYRREPLLAILPGVALQELWDLMRTAEQALAAISIFVVATSLLSMIIMLLAGIAERRREMAILRSVGARPGHIFALLVTEASLLSLIGIGLGLGLLYLGLVVLQPIVATYYGLYISIGAPTAYDFGLMALVLLAGFCAGMVPALIACRQALADGMIVRG